MLIVKETFVLHILDLNDKFMISIPNSYYATAFSRLGEPSGISCRVLICMAGL